MVSGSLVLLSPTLTALADQPFPHAVYLPNDNVIVQGAQEIKRTARSITIVLKGGTYTSNGIDQAITDALSYAGELDDSEFFIQENPLVLSTEDPNSTEIRWVTCTNGVFNVDTGYEYYNIHTNEREAFFKGATQSALEFDEGGRGVHMWKYLHQPLFNPASGQTPEETIAFFLQDNRYFRVDQDSGIYLTDLQPTWLWQNVFGFDMSTLITPVQVDGTGMQYILLSDLLPRVTKGFAGNQSYNPNYDPDKSDETKFPMYVNVDQETKPLVAGVPNIDTDGGYFEIELKAGFLAGYYLDAAGNRPHVFAIIPKEYTNGNTVTGFDDSGFDFVYSGEPSVISEMEIRIIDPSTKQTSASLGSYSSFIFELIRSGELAAPPRPLAVKDSVKA
jgi:hypothetical protein